MKRFVAIALSALMLMSSPIYANDIGVKLNGESISFSNQAPVIVNDRTLVPLRGVFEKLGYTIGWDSDTKTATLTKDDTQIKVTANGDNFIVNGSPVLAEVPAQIINSSMMLPLRAIAELAGAEVSWDNATKTVSISTELDQEVIDKNAAAIANETTTEATTQEQSTVEKPDDTQADYDIEAYISNLEYRILCNNIVLLTAGIIDDANDEIAYAKQHDSKINYDSQLTAKQLMLTSLESTLTKGTTPSELEELKDTTISYIQHSQTYLVTALKMDRPRSDRTDIMIELRELSTELDNMYDQCMDALDEQEYVDEDISDHFLTEDDISTDENTEFEAYGKKVAKDFKDIFKSIPVLDPNDYGTITTYRNAISNQVGLLKDATEQGKKALANTTPPEYCSGQNNFVQLSYDYFAKRSEVTSAWLNGDILTAEYYVLNLTYSYTQVILISMFTGVDLQEELYGTNSND